MAFPRCTSKASTKITTSWCALAIHLPVLAVARKGKVEAVSFRMFLMPRALLRHCAAPAVPQL